MSKFLVKSNIHLLYASAILPPDIYLREMETHDPHTALIKKVHSSSSHNSSKVEITQISINRRIEKQFFIYSCYEILLKSKKQLTIDTWHTRSVS